MWDVIIHVCPNFDWTATEVKTWMSNYIPSFYLDVLTYPGPHPRCFLAHLPGQNGRHFADDIFLCIFTNEKFCILIKIPPKFVPKGPIDNKPAFV